MRSRYLVGLVVGLLLVVLFNLGLQVVLVSVVIGRALDLIVRAGAHRRQGG